MSSEEVTLESIKGDLVNLTNLTEEIWQTLSLYPHQGLALNKLSFLKIEVQSILTKVEEM